MRLFISLLAVLAVAACGGRTTERDFLCDAQTPGQPCTTISQADVSSGAHTRPIAERATDTLNREIGQAPLIARSKQGSGTAAMPDGGQSYRAAQYRIPEQVGTLWIAPHEDADGLLHEASFVHFVVRPAHWASTRP